MLWISRYCALFVFLGAVSAANAGTLGFGQPGYQEPIDHSLQGTGEENMELGRVCERVARTDLAKTYPSSLYFIENGVFYGDARRPGNVMGEIDVVVLDRITDQVILAIEIKCWSHNQRKAFLKADSQRSRFLSALLSRNLEIWSPSRRYSMKQFKTITSVNFKLGAPRGMRIHGFEYELPYTMDQLLELRDRSLRDQLIGSRPRW